MIEGKVDEYPVLFDEFKASMEMFLASVEGQTKMRHLSDIIAFNKDHPETCLQHGQVYWRRVMISRAY